MICKLDTADSDIILNVINNAASIYKGKIPADCWREPYMSKGELQEEIDSGVQFYGFTKDCQSVAVMGIQPVDDVTLIRHAYTIANHQRKGFGEKLLIHLLTIAKTQRVLVGTWETAIWAINFYQKHGFVLLSRQETNNLLRRYWNIPTRQVETSIVLELKRQKT